MTPQEAAPEPEMRTWPTLRKLLARFGRHPWRTAFTFALLLARTVLEVSAPLFVMYGIAILVRAPAGTVGLPDEFVVLLVALGGVLLARSALIYLSAVAAAALGQDLENALRTELLTRVTALRFRYHDENRSGKTIARSLRDMEKARHFFREVALGYAEAVLLLAGVIGFSFYVHWTYGAAVAVVSLGAVGATTRMGLRVATLDREASELYDDVATVLQENVAGARVVRAFGREPEESGKFGGRLVRFTRSWIGLDRFWTTAGPWVGSIYDLLVPVTLVLAVERQARGVGGVEEAAAVLLWVKTLKNRLRRPLTRLVVLGQQAVASAARVFEVTEHGDVIEPPAAPLHLPARGGDVRLEDVWFSHPASGPVLRGVSLHVPAGGSLGILGPTGSGKTSLVHLLPRFYDPDRGRVLIDGIDVRDLPVRELREAVGLVFQEPFLFSATVADNVAYGRPGVERARVEECVRLAAGHDFVSRLPRGYETIVGERGVSLSGGQRQRLTIARALAMDPRVLVFDDATASVDAVTEKELFRGIRAAAEGRTTLVISQRVTSLRWCDRIAVLDRGRVVAVGTHRELVDGCLLYREIFRHQQLEAGQEVAS